MAISLYTVFTKIDVKLVPVMEVGQYNEKKAQDVSIPLVLKMNKYWLGPVVVGTTALQNLLIPWVPLNK